MNKITHFLMKNVCFSLLFIFLSSSFCLLHTKDAKAREYYITNNFDVSIDVSQDNVYKVKEDITLTFLEGRRGFFRYIPKNYVLTRYIDEVLDQRNYISFLHNPYVEGHPFSFFKNGKEIYTFKIGDENKVVNGRQDYKISYDLLLPEDSIDTFDDVYYNVIPHQWPTVIEKANIAVNLPYLPENIANNPQEYIEVITGKINGNNTHKARFSIQGNTVKIQLIEPLDAYEGITFRLVLPQAYFVERPFSLSVYELFLWGICLSFLFLALVLWSKYIKQRAYPEPLSFYPPHEYNPAEISFILKGGISARDFSTMLLYFVSKNYILLDVDKDNKSYVTKHQVLPTNAKEHERIFYDGLFIHGDTVCINDIPREYYALLQKSVSSLSMQFKKSKEQIYSANKALLLFVFAFLAIIPYLIMNFGDYTMSEDAFIFSFVSSFSCFFMLMLKLRGNIKRKKKIIPIIFLTFFALILSSIPAFLATTLYDNKITPLIVVSSVLIILYLAPTKTNLTSYGEKILGEVKGFRNFIEVSEIDRLNALVDENPVYFYDILPYAYVFGLSTAWLDKLQLVKLPQSEIHKHNDYYSNDSAYNRLTHNIAALGAVQSVVQSTQNAIASENRSNSSSGGGGGGSRGSSGGGAGGGGGASW